MKSFFCFVSLLAAISISSAATAQVRNPLMRVCFQQQGQFWVFNNGDVRSELAVCRFDATFISALDLVHMNQGSAPLSAQAFLGSYRVFDACSEIRAQDIVLSSENVHICRFNDGSFIDIKALQWGRLSPQTQKLERALKNLKESEATDKRID